MRLWNSGVCSSSEQHAFEYFTDFGCMRPKNIDCNCGQSSTRATSNLITHATMHVSTAVLCGALAAGSVQALNASSTIVLDGTTALHRYDGHGGLSAGASSRLLWDYPPDVASDILDFMFKPQFGLGLHVLKVEIGGDTQSTDGTEPSHMHTRDDLSCGRGYELWLLKEAKKRNPDILTFGLSWGTPYWPGNGSYFTPDMYTYQVAWMQCMAQELGVPIDYLGVWNERYWGGQDYVVGLRASLNAAGFADTKIVIPDGGYDPAIIAGAQSNATFSSSFDVVGLHYPCGDQHPEVQEAGKAYWASEHWWQQPDWDGAGCWGHLLNHNYVAMNMTSTIAWSPLWSVYEKGLPDEGSGLILAPEPWSGYWEVSPPIWTGAQWTQFTQPGWKFLHVPGGGSGYLPMNGTYVTLVPPGGPSAGMTVIMETLQGACRCSPDPVTGPQTVTFKTTGGMPGAGTLLHVWQTTQEAPFVQLADMTIAPDSTFTVTIPADAMVTVTTVAGGFKGQPGTPIPPSTPFPLPYSDDFDSYTYDGMAHFFADQFGSFAVRNGTLVQVVPVNPGKNAWISDADPITLMGGVNWADVTVSVRTAFQPNPAVAVGDGAEARLMPCDPSSPFQQWTWDSPATGYLSNTPPPTIGAEQQCLNVFGCDTKLVYWSCVTSGGTCCGADCYQNLQWTLNAAGQLITDLSSHACVTYDAGGKGMIVAPCGSAANQTWVYNKPAQQLQLSGSSLCLAQPSPPPVRTYSQVCARMASLAVFSAPTPPTGYCFGVDSTGTWNITTGAGSIAGGVLSTGPPAPGSWHTLTLTTTGTTLTVAVDGVTVITLQDSTYTNGYVALGSGYHPAQFVNFSVTAASAS